jgi:hypothetical protein
MASAGINGSVRRLCLAVAIPILYRRRHIGGAAPSVRRTANPMILNWNVGQGI